jgi:prepilin-type N-terminal cleavage/methylation domain-containing protein
MYTSQGFSVVEVVIAVAVVSILAGIAGATFITQIPNYRLNGATRQVAWELMAARMQAIREKHAITVTFMDDHTYTIWKDTNNDGDIDTGEVTTKDIWDDYHDTSLTSTQNPTFDVTGKITNPPSITVTNSSGIKSITVSIAGMVKVH